MNFLLLLWKWSVLWLQRGRRVVVCPAREDGTGSPLHFCLPVMDSTSFCCLQHTHKSVRRIGFQRFSRMSRSLTHLVWYLEILKVFLFSHVYDTVLPNLSGITIMFKSIMFEVALLLCLFDVLWVSIQNCSHPCSWFKRSLATKRSLDFSAWSSTF